MELCDLALEIAREAGALIERMRTDGVSVGSKSTVSDLVTAADTASEELIRRRIAEHRPDDAIMGEEGDDVAGRSGLRWVVDPIDGTVNYVMGLPDYCVSVAVTRGSDVVAGAIVNPALGVEYVASLGGGAFRNGVPLKVREPREQGRLVVGTGFSYDPEVRARQGAATARLLPQVADVRRFGSCALDLCRVAEGSLDGYVEDHVGGWWDHAAGGLVATEAGAGLRVLDRPDGGQRVVAAPRASFEAFVALVTSCGFLEA